MAGCVCLNPEKDTTKFLSIFPREPGVPCGELFFSILCVFGVLRG